MPLTVFKNGRVDTTGCIKRKGCFMPDNRNRKRPIQVKFFVDEKELAAIKQRMTKFGADNLSAYLRIMAMEGIFPTADGEKISKQGKPQKS